MTSACYASTGLDALKASENSPPGPPRGRSIWSQSDTRECVTTTRPTTRERVMAIRTVMGIILTLTVGATPAGAAGREVTGLVTAATDKSLEIRTHGKETTTISVDDKTGYMKWITHQPWQQDNRASRQSVAVGSCVDIELRADDSRVAKIVRINADGAGTLYDPCKAIRQIDGQVRER
jgi:hypothetical protein